MIYDGNGAVVRQVYYCPDPKCKQKLLRFNLSGSGTKSTMHEHIWYKRFKANKKAKNEKQQLEAEPKDDEPAAKKRKMLHKNILKRALGHGKATKSSAPTEQSTPAQVKTPPPAQPSTSKANTSTQTCIAAIIKKAASKTDQQPRGKSVQK